jgi:hypothetical protein
MMLLSSLVVTPNSNAQTSCTGCQILSSGNNQSFAFNNWLIVQAYSEVTGFNLYQSGSSSITINQVQLYSLSLDNNFQAIGSCIDIPEVENIKIGESFQYIIANNYGSSLYPDSTIIQNINAYDNSNNGNTNSLPQIIVFALNTAYSYLSYWLKWPLPNPWTLISLLIPSNQVYTQQTLTVANVIYSYSPVGQSYLTTSSFFFYINHPPIRDGFYFFSANATGDAGLSESCDGGPPIFYKTGNINIQLGYAVEVNFTCAYSNPSCLGG